MNFLCRFPSCQAEIPWDLWLGREWNQIKGKRACEKRVVTLCHIEGPPKAGGHNQWVVGEPGGAGDCPQRFKDWEGSRGSFDLVPWDM